MTAGPRIVHGYSAAGNAVVRYDRAGKYYVEFSGMRRKKLTLAEAVQLVADPDGSWCEGAAGGMRFDAEVRKAIGKRR